MAKNAGLPEYIITNSPVFSQFNSFSHSCGPSERNPNQKGIDLKRTNQQRGMGYSRATFLPVSYFPYTVIKK
jgi:hypothetical protein